MSTPPIQTPFDENGLPSKAWIEWADNISSNSKYKGSDTTASRPTNGLNNGDFYMDTTLGIPIYYLNNGWVDATGASV